MDKSFGISLSEIADKYNLHDDDVRRIVEDSISRTLSRILSFEVETMITDDNEIRLWGYFDINGEFEAREIPLDNIKKNIVRLIKFDILQELEKQSVFAKYTEQKHLTTLVKYGMVTRVGETIYVELEGIAGENVVASCTRKEQPVRERENFYRKGQILPFYVLRVQPVYVGDVPRLEICLSRRSKSLVEELLRAGARDTRIVCIKRIAGAKSIVRTDKPLPKELIKKVADELEERIDVKWEKK